MDTHQKSIELHGPAAQQRSVSHPYPLGPTVTAEGTNFSVFSANATGMEIVFFDHVDDPQPSRLIGLARRGTYLGVIEKIPYLRELGITAVEVFPGDENSVPGLRRDRYKMVC